MPLVSETAPGSWLLSWREWRLKVEVRNGRVCAATAGPGRHDGAGGDDLAFGHVSHPGYDDYAGTVVETVEHGRASMELVAAEQLDDGLRIALRDCESGVQLTSNWIVDTDCDLVTHRPLLSLPAGATPVTVTRADTLGVDVLGPRRHTILTGAAKRENQRTEVGTHAPLLLESRSGKTGFEAAPYLAMHADGWALALTLPWSGNWRMRTVSPEAGRVRVNAGLNPWRLRARLGPGETLALPTAKVTFGRPGLGEVTRSLHRHRRRARRRQGLGRPVPIQFNSWYPHPVRPDLATILDLAGRARDLGCEVFVQDAGWYTNVAAADDVDWRLRVGDWIADEERFPGGLSRFGAEVRALGLGVGIWMEPEVAAGTSQVARRHPEWLHPQRNPPMGRQLIDLGDLDAREWAAAAIDRVLRESGATWLKWDYNADLVPDPVRSVHGRDPVLGHVEGVHALQDTIRSTHPELTLEMCAGGGGRFNDEIMDRAHTTWMSDQTQALPNLAIHFGSQLLHLPEECNDWLVDWPPHDTGCGVVDVDERGDLGLRAAVAMLGSFGISAPLSRWSDHEMRQVAAQVRWYRERVRPLFADADQYLLTAQPGLDGSGEWAAVWYAAENGRAGHLTAVRLADGGVEWNGPLAGLDPDLTYAVEAQDGTRSVCSGRELADGAVRVQVDSPYTAAMLSVRALPPG